MTSHAANSYTASTLVVSEYESGWYVEKPDGPLDSCDFIQVAGPFESQSDAYAMKRVLDRAEAKRPNK